MLKPFDEVFEDKTKYGTKIKTDDYHISGTHIIIDQGQEQIAGYTDLEKGLFTEVPAIIFGDHTRIIKYVDRPFFLGADGVKVLRCRYEDANYKYLYYALKSVRIPNTGYNRHFKWLKEAKIFYPDKNAQARIVEALEKTSEIIEKRQQQLSALDNLIKARFIEMFGTVSNNRYGFRTKALADIATVFFAGGDKPNDCTNVQDEKHPYPVYANGFENEGLQGYSNQCRVRSKAVTISARGTIGYCFIRQADFTPVVRLITIVPNDEVSVEYLKYAIDTMQIKCSGTSQAQLTVPNFKRESIIVPPIDRQQDFANFVAQVDKSKSVIQKSLDETQLLFDSLIQKYFG